MPKSYVKKRGYQLEYDKSLNRGGGLNGKFCCEITRTQLVRGDKVEPKNESTQNTTLYL